MCQLQLDFVETLKIESIVEREQPEGRGEWSVCQELKPLAVSFYKYESCTSPLTVQCGAAASHLNITVHHD